MAVERRSDWKVSVLLALCLGVGTAQLGGCASSGDAKKALNPDPPAKMYAEADAYMSKRRWDDAAKKFEDLDRDHPYAPEARRAIVMAAFAYYKGGKYPEAIAAAQRYTTLHPGTKDAALAHHIIASANFDDMKDPARDQGATRKALKELKTLVTNYPDSPYTKQAENRIRICEDALAASEMNVGRYYLKNGNQVAAINRFKTVVAEYQTTAHVEEALMRLTEAYVSLGIATEAQSAAAVLGHNFPQSRWYSDSYALLQKAGLKPQMISNTWVGQQWKNEIRRGPNGKPEPLPEPLAPNKQTPPGNTTPSQDIPTASTTRGKPMGLMTGSVN
jgi:outer membrane protein assembly factor BamD